MKVFQISERIAKAINAAENILRTHEFPDDPANWLRAIEVVREDSYEANVTILFWLYDDPEMRVAIEIVIHKDSGLWKPVRATSSSEFPLLKSVMGKTIWLFGSNGEIDYSN